MDLSYRTTPIFPVPIHLFDVNGFEDIEDELIAKCYDIQKSHPDGVCVSNRGGWQSPGFNVNNQDDVIQSFLMNCLSNFPNIKKSVQLYVHAWININQKGNYNEKHFHPISDLSGVLWVKTPKNCGNIVFDSPVGFQTHQEIVSYNDDFINKFNYDHTYYFNAVKGRIIVFPAYLQHLVELNQSDEDRISISFNIRLKDG